MAVIHIISVYGKQEQEFFSINKPSKEAVEKFMSVSEPADAATTDLSQIENAFVSNAEEKSVNDTERSISTMR